MHVLKPVVVTDLMAHMSCGSFSILSSKWRGWHSCGRHDDKCDVFLLRAPEERLVRRENLAHPELLDPPVPADPLEMTVPRVTLYVSSTAAHTVMTDSLLELSATESPCHISQ